MYDIRKWKTNKSFIYLKQSRLFDAQNWEMIIIRTLQEAVTGNLRLVRQNLI